MNIPLSAVYDTSGAPVEADVLDIGNTLLFSKEQLEQTPSRKEGMSVETEEKLRLKACEIIHGVLALCGVDRMVICTAHVYLHRYYCQRTITAFNFKVHTSSISLGYLNFSFSMWHWQLLTWHSKLKKRISQRRN